MRERCVQTRRWGKGEITVGGEKREEEGQGSEREGRGKMGAHLPAIDCTHYQTRREIQGTSHDVCTHPTTPTPTHTHTHIKLTLPAKHPICRVTKE